MPTENRNHPDDHAAIESLHQQYVGKIERFSDDLMAFQDRAYAMGLERGKMLAAAPVPPQAEKRCSCPSGDGSLAWPCQRHPPQVDAQPVMRLVAEKLLGLDGEYAVDFVKPGWLEECRKTGGTFMLYTHPDADEAHDLLAATSLEAGERINALEKERDTLRIQRDEANDLLKKLADIDVSAIDLDYDHWQYLLGEVSLQLHTTEEWRMNPCKQGHRDVGAAGGSAHCYQCGEEIVAATTQEAFEQWNATHPAASADPEVRP